MKKTLASLSFNVYLLCLCIPAFSTNAGLFNGGNFEDPPTKVKDIVIYENPMFYSSFPSIVKKEDGEYILAFRRAPERKIFGEKGSNHVDPNSFLVKVTSRDGINWSESPELI